MLSCSSLVMLASAGVPRGSCALLSFDSRLPLPLTTSTLPHIHAHTRACQDIASLEKKMKKMQAERDKKVRTGGVGEGGACVWCGAFST